MRTVEEHLSRVLSLGSRLPAEPCPVGEGFGRVLAEDLAAVVAVPPFDNSAMDGFAVRAEDLAVSASLRVVGDVPSGATSVPRVGNALAGRGG